jgi:hypothetical protein
MPDTKFRKVWEGEIACASCHQPNRVKVEKEIITPSKPAEFEIRVTVEKCAQKTLDATAE